MITTNVVVSFQRPEAADVRIEIDLTLLMGSPERYYELAQSSGERQRKGIEELLPKLEDALQLYVGRRRLKPALRGFTVATATRAEFLDSSVSKHSTFNLTAAIPAERGPIRLQSPVGAPIDYPVAYTVLIPAAKLSVTRWLGAGVHESDALDWASRMPAQLAGGGGAPAPSAAEIPPDLPPWPMQLAQYLRLGFRHIVPEGADHILFVLGLFFLGITWRKLLSQTTVFTVAHATTLFLSSYGILRLPGSYVEPAIALSIAVIAAENVYKTQAGPARLAIVFAFGLIHGLGFASSLSDVPFPRKDFVLALLGFNLGVDFGQLFIIAVAFLLVGWFRNKPWFRSRIAIPCSLAIAGVGLLWAVQRAFYYATR